MLLLLYFVPLLSSWLSIALAVDHSPRNCEPKSCGNLSIRYPFWIRDQQPGYGGFPPFELRCDDGKTASLLAPQGTYIVLNISYKIQSLTVAGPSLVSGEVCFAPSNNLSFPSSPFAVSLSNSQLIFTHNCTEMPSGSMRIDCHGHNTSLAYLGGPYGAPVDERVFGSCHTAVRPVLSFPGAKVEDYLKLLASGFLLDWIAPNCSEYRASNGQCGYNNATGDFMCICHDRFQRWSCSNKHGRKVLVIVLSAGGSGVIFGICSSILCGILRKCWKKKKRRIKKKRCNDWNILMRIGSCQGSSGKSDGSDLGCSLHAPIFSYEELHEATGGFDSSKELGDGGFGTVYQGKLRDGRAVAVKRLYENNYRRVEHFVNEVRMLSLLRHRNLVRLYGCTSRRSRELLVVYEYVPNGTVAEHLHGARASAGSFLPWPLRLSIAIETADAVSYLHSNQPQIVHRDVKTSNILLDADFRVKVADFGLSRHIGDGDCQVSTAPQGTPGYLDPEYHRCLQLTEKSDVYSFGVVLMELVSSMPAIDVTRRRSEVTLAGLAIAKIQARELHHLVDPRLGFHSNTPISRMISQVAELAFLCLQPHPDLRPSIAHALHVLTAIRDDALNNNNNNNN